jgi:hypothetical protein
MAAIAVREDTQRYKLEGHLERASREAIAAGQSPGPEVGTVEIVLDDLVVYGSQTNPMLAWCETRRMKVVKGALPAKVQPVELGQNLVWPVELLGVYQKTRVVLSTNGVTEVTRIEPVLEKA